MFKGSKSISLKSDKSKEKVIELIVENLETIGSVEISNRGSIKINTSRFNGFAHDSEINGFVDSKENKYTIELNWESKPKWLLIIIISLCSCGLGLVLLIMPLLANNDMQSKVLSICDKIKFEID
jgi:hypothetical protein